MNRVKKVIRNMVILATLSYVFVACSGLYLSPISAHEHSERSIHYGPSKVVHVEDFEKGKYILGKFDKWVSCNTVRKELFFFWRFGNQPVGFKVDRTKALDYTWGSSVIASSQYYKLYGIINDHGIQKVEIVLVDGSTFSQTGFYEDMFLFTWKSDAPYNGSIQCIKAYDTENNVIFEEEFP